MRLFAYFYDPSLIVQDLTTLAARFLPEWAAPLVGWGVAIGVIATLAPVIMMYLTWLERKVIARIQNRFGPNRVGKYGLLQPLADGVKMLTKEDIVPDGADRVAHFLAPCLAVAPALMIFLVIPFGRHLIAADLNLALLYFLAVSAVGSFAVFIGGWASRSKFSVLGAMRSGAQLISYEVPMTLSVVTVLMMVGSFSLTTIVEAQERLWFVFTPWGFVGFLIFFMAGIAEVNRTPFDLPEGESELVAGFHTEYSGMKFALFYMGEFLGAFAAAAFSATLFLGGWQGPFLPSWLWFFLKTYALIFVMIWLRGTFPRLRIDQLMGFAWKFLVPMALANILAAGCELYLPFPVSTLSAIALLVGAFVVLVRVNQAAVLERRVYRYAE